MIAAPILAPFLVLAGLAGGSYCANAALRAERGEQAWIGPSRCDACQTPLGIARTLPVIAFVAQRGACSVCGARIDPLHLVGEIGGAAVVLGALLAPSPLRALLLAVIGFALLSSSITDLKSRRLPDLCALLIAASAVLLAILASASAVIEGLAAALLVFIVLEAVRRGYQRLRRRSGLGFGDVKLLSALALWLGLATPWAVVLASLLGLVTFAVARPRDQRIAFGPMIALAAWTVGIGREAGLWLT